MDTISAIFGGFAVGMLFVLAFQIGKIRNRTLAISRVEAKLNLLLQSAGLEYDPYAEVSDDVAKAMRSGDKMLAIKLVRYYTDYSFSEATQFIEELDRRNTTTD